MEHASIGRCCRVALLASAVVGTLAVLGPVAIMGCAQGAAAQLAATPEAMAEYRRKLDVYRIARAAFDRRATGYWTAIADKRRLRIAKRRAGQPILLGDYVLIQPPVYAGPPRPVDPSAPQAPVTRRYVPVVGDFLQAATEYFHFVPERARSETDFKRAYARAAAAAGITREQAVRIYVFEAGGNGRYDVQAGLEYASPKARAISTALGYNQLLTTNTISILAHNGNRFVAALEARAATLSGAPRRAVERKLSALRRMIAFCRTVPNAWSAHERLARTPKGLGVHAMVLDIDVGPLLQTRKLLDSIEFARRKGYVAPLSAAELEMMNLTGDGNGFDMVTMPAEWRARVPTSNFFQRGGYERNPVAIRNNVVARLIAATNAHMDKQIQMPGARELAALFPRSP